MFDNLSPGMVPGPFDSESPGSSVNFFLKYLRSHLKPVKSDLVEEG